MDGRATLVWSGPSRGCGVLVTLLRLFCPRTPPLRPGLRVAEVGEQQRLASGDGGAGCGFGCQRLVGEEEPVKFQGGCYTCLVCTYIQVGCRELQGRAKQWFEELEGWYGPLVRRPRRVPCFAPATGLHLARRWRSRGATSQCLCQRLGHFLSLSKSWRRAEGPLLSVGGPASACSNGEEEQEE